MVAAVKDVNTLKIINVKSTVSIGNLGDVLCTLKIQMRSYIQTVATDGENNEFI